MKIAYRVQSCPGREQIRSRLLSSLPSPETIIDDGPLEGWHAAGPWRGYIRCLSDPPDCTHLCVIQDDATVCTNFTVAVERVACVRPETVICLFVPGSARQTARDMYKRSHMSLLPLQFREFLPVVGVIWPVEQTFRILEWAKDAQLPGMPRPPQSDDAVAGAWRRAERAEVLVTNPSLIEHPDDVPSTVGRRAMGGLDKGRIAARYIGDGDPLEIDWV